MAHKKNTTNLTELLLQCVTQPDPMLSMLEWLCTHLMEAEVDQLLGAEKSQRTDGRSGYRSGYRPRRLDTRMGTMYLMVPKVRQGGCIPFFVTERKRSEAMLVQVVQEAFVQGVSTRKMEKLAHSLGIENLSRSQVSEMTKGLNGQVEEFRNRSLAGTIYPWSAVSESEGPWSVHAQTYHFRCSLRAGFGNPRVIFRRLVAALQGTFHAEYSCRQALPLPKSLHFDSPRRERSSAL